MYKDEERTVGSFTELVEKLFTVSTVLRHTEFCNLLSDKSVQVHIEQSAALIGHHAEFLDRKYQVLFGPKPSHNLESTPGDTRAIKKSQNSLDLPRQEGHEELSTTDATAEELPSSTAERQPDDERSLPSFYSYLRENGVDWLDPKQVEVAWLSINGYYRIEAVLMARHHGEWTRGSGGRRRKRPVRLDDSIKTSRVLA